MIFGFWHPAAENKKKRGTSLYFLIYISGLHLCVIRAINGGSGQTALWELRTMWHWHAEGGGVKEESRKHSETCLTYVLETSSVRCNIRVYTADVQGVQLRYVMPSYLKTEQHSSAYVRNRSYFVLVSVCPLYCWPLLKTAYHTVCPCMLALI